jgi:hypothetical protein
MNNNPMTPDQNVRAINNFLLEHCDGFLCIAFDPQSKEPMIAVSVVDGKTETALNSILSGILQGGGVGGVRDAIKAKANETPPPE